MTLKDLTRRQFLALGALALAGCSTSETEPVEETEADEAPAEPETSAEPSPEPAPADAASTLVLVFSRAGDNYNVGVVERGNTAVIADMLAERTGADLFELEPVVAYPEDYDECCDVALEEKNAGARPELVALPDLAAYDRVFFGFPVWWGDIPMPVYTAIEALDWNGKVICPFNTHEGSGEAGMFATLAQVCAGATVTEGLTVRGQDAQNDREGTQAAVDAWLAGLGL